MTQSTDPAYWFWLRVHRHRPDACWTWLGAKDHKGYGIVYDRSRRRRMPAHRVAFELLVGPIPPGLHIDHLCRNPICCNVAHLEPVTQAENTRRGLSASARNAAKNHCKHGHPFTETNTYYRPTGGRRCRRCGSRDSNDLNKRKRWTRTECPNGHPYSEGYDLDAIGRRRCRQCYKRKAS